MNDYYDSPITVLRTGCDMAVDEYVTNETIKAVVKYNIDVDIDKEKLIAALKQDQKRYMDAYRKGYAAGYESAKNETTPIPKEER